MGTHALLTNLYLGSHSKHWPNSVPEQFMQFATGHCEQPLVAFTPNPCLH